MAMFYVLAAAMIAAALAFVIVPLAKASRGAAGATTARRLQALDEARAAGIVDAAEYRAKRAAIEAAADGAAPPAPSRAASAAVLLVALLLPAGSLLLYRLVGTPQALDAAPPAAAPSPHGDSGPQMEQAIATLAQRLKEHPDDVEGWALLGRAYQATGRAAEALDALRHAHELAPDNTAVTVEYAQDLAVSSPEHRIAGEARALLEGALKAEPENQRALWLLGIADYQEGRFDAAIGRWNVLLPLLPADSDVAESVKKQIADAEARRDGKLPPEPLAAEGDGGAPAEAAAPSATAAGATAASDAAPAKLTVRVALDPKLKDRADPDATLFVFARAASGPPMPLAIRKLKTAQLPLTVTLDDSTGVMPTMKLSMAQQVIVGARISKSGNAMPQSGDLQGLSAPLDAHRSEPVELTIGQAVP